MSTIKRAAVLTLAALFTVILAGGAALGAVGASIIYLLLKIVGRLVLYSAIIFVLLWLASWFVGPALLGVVAAAHLHALWQLAVLISLTFYCLRVGFRWIKE